MDKNKRIKTASNLLKFEPLAFLEAVPSAIIFLDRKWAIRYVNTRAVTMIGTTKHRLLGSPFSQFISYFAVPLLYDVVETATNTHQSQSIVFYCPLTHTQMRGYLSPCNKGIALFFQEEINITSWQGTPHSREQEQHIDDFLSMVSHELKTPLTSLKLQTQLLKKRLQKHDEVSFDRPLSVIETQINTITRLVEDLLDFSATRVGELACTQEVVDLNEVLHEKVEMVRRVQNTHVITVHRRTTCTPIVMGDRCRLGQVILNLLNNAIKYSPDANGVEMHIETDPHTWTVTISVCDRGIGIPLKQQEKIFERFYRAVTPEKAIVTGLGMGLHIASKIVQHHMGNIMVESQPGKGSIFRVVLPLHHL